MNEKTEQAPRWLPTEEFFEAFRMACTGHALDTRKGSDIPYIGHLLGVASSVIEAGGSREQAMGAFLHDLVEDTDTTDETIRTEFGKVVADIVAACTDATKAEKQIEKDLVHSEYCKSWWERKSKYIEALTAKTLEDHSVLVALADKTYNAENTAADLRGLNNEERTVVWSKFNVGEEWQKRWYLGLRDAFSQNKTYDKYSQPLHNRFITAVEEMFSSTQQQ